MISCSRSRSWTFETGRPPSADGNHASLSGFHADVLRRESKQGDALAEQLLNLPAQALDHDDPAGEKRLVSIVGREFRGINLDRAKDVWPERPPLPQAHQGMFGGWGVGADRVDPPINQPIHRRLDQPRSSQDVSLLILMVPMPPRVQHHDVPRLDARGRGREILRGDLPPLALGDVENDRRPTDTVERDLVDGHPVGEVQGRRIQVRAGVQRGGNGSRAHAVPRIPAEHLELHLGMVRRARCLCRQWLREIKDLHRPSPHAQDEPAVTRSPAAGACPPAARVNRLAAAFTRSRYSLIRSGVKRNDGPETVRLATTAPWSSKIGALTAVAPSTRSPTVAATPSRRISASDACKGTRRVCVRAVKRGSFCSRKTRSAASRGKNARIAFPAAPACSG